MTDAELTAAAQPTAKP